MPNIFAAKADSGIDNIAAKIMEQSKKNNSRTLFIPFHILNIVIIKNKKTVSFSLKNNYFLGDRKIFYRLCKIIEKYFIFLFFIHLIVFAI